MLLGLLDLRQPGRRRQFAKRVVRGPAANTLVYLETSPSIAVPLDKQGRLSEKFGHSHQRNSDPVTCVLKALNGFEPTRLIEMQPGHCRDELRLLVSRSSGCVLAQIQYEQSDSLTHKLWVGVHRSYPRGFDGGIHHPKWLA
jgi:hypothetical protein